MKIRAARQRIRQLKWMSPGSFLLCAVTFAGVYLVLHAAGFRESTSVFCGTLPTAHGEQVRMGFCALLYTIFYMLTVLAAPILVIAAGVFVLLVRRTATRAVRLAVDGEREDQPSGQSRFL